MLFQINLNEEYEWIVVFIKGENLDVNGNKQKKHRLKQKATEFCLISDILYLKNGEGKKNCFDSW